MKSQREGAITLEEAQALVAASVTVLATEEISLQDALGRVLGQSVTSDVDCPSANVSAMDGYAFAARSTEHASSERPVRLRQVGCVRAGEVPLVRGASDGVALVDVGPGECVEIMTGAVLPRGCDAVAKWEDVEAGPAPAPAWIALTQPVTRWAFVRRQGEVFTRGETFGPGTPLNLEGQRVTPAVAGLLAALGARRILVTRRPRVGILATGDELVPFDACCGPGQVRSSNAPMLAGLAAAIGCETVALGSSRDSVDEIARHLTEARGLDAVLVSGGVSGGKFDLVSRALTTLGAEIGFSAIRMSPGKRVTCARLGGTICWCLPGSPGAALVGFVMIARPGLLRMMGLDDIEPAVVRARSTGPIEKTSGCTRLVPGALERRGQLQRRGILRNPSPGRGAAPRAPTEVEPLGLRGSADVVAVAQADCLIRLGEDRGPVAAGEIVDVLLL